MPNTSSKLAEQIHDQYFTPVDTAKWCFEHAHDVAGWDFEGTALEPSVGAFAFVTAAEQLGLKLKWVTNDLYPQPNQLPDHQLDFRDLDIGPLDYCVTNPPFGKANTLAKIFAKKGCEIASRCIMLLPRGAMRIGFQDAMPRTSKKVVESLLPDETFITSCGQEKQVKTCLMAWEKVDYEIPTFKSQLDLRDDLFVHWASDKDDWDAKFGPIDFQVARWGNMGFLYPEERQKKSGARVSVHCKGISHEEFVSIHESIDLSDFVLKSTNHPPAFDVPVWVHRFNTEAVRRGLLDPK